MTREEKDKNKILPDENSAANATAESAQKAALSGVDKQYTDKVNSTFTATDTQNKAQGKASNQLLLTSNMLDKDNIVDKGTWGTINQRFTTPKAVTKADAYLKDALTKIQEGKTSYSESVKGLMDKISGRDKFSYDVDNDPLFQQALASAMNSGKSAMQDTIGQASALTGGYGSSYATSAANQAYNSFIEDAYNNLPQYYEMALEAYNAEGDELYRQLDMYNAADEKDYGRMMNAYEATGAYRDRLYNEAYQQFRDSKSDAFASANLQLSEHGQLSNDALNLYNAYVNEADKMYEREYQKWSDEVDNAMQYAQMLNSNYWNQTNFDEGVRQFDDKLAFEDKWNQMNFDEGVRQFNTKLENDNYWNQQEMDYKNNALAKQDEWNKNELGYKYSALKQDQTQFEASQAAKAAAKEGELDGIPSGITKKAGSFKNNGDLEAYLNGQVDSGAITEDEGIALYNTYATPEQLPYNKRTWTVVDKGGNNYFGGIDNNAIVKDQYDNEYRMDDLYKELKKTMSAKDAKDYIKRLQKDIGITKK